MKFYPAKITCYIVCDSTIDYTSIAKVWLCINTRTAKTCKYLEAPCGVIWQQKCFLPYQCHFWYLLIIFHLYVIQGIVKKFPLKVLDGKVACITLLWSGSKIWTWIVWLIAQSRRVECLIASNCFILWTCNANNVTEPKDSRLVNQNEKKKDCKVLQQQGLSFRSFTSFHWPESDHWRQNMHCKMHCPRISWWHLLQHLVIRYFLQALFYSLLKNFNLISYQWI